MSREMYNYKRKAIKVAKDFRYGDIVVNAINNAKTISEISRIMRKARLTQEV